jgi:hypothetical protein
VVPDERTVQVKGLKEFQGAIRDIDRALGGELRKGLNEAAEIVAGAARPLVPVRSGAAAASIKVGSTQRAAQIKVGGQAAPYFPWLDFGGRVGAKKTTRRPFIRAGRYIYPVLAAKRADVEAKVDEVIKRLATQAGFGTTGRM